MSHPPPSPNGATSATTSPGGILITPHGSPTATMIAAAAAQKGSGLVVLPPPPLTFKNLTIHTSLMSTKYQLRQQQHQYHQQLNAALQRQQIDVTLQQQLQLQQQQKQQDGMAMRADKLAGLPTTDATERRRVCSDTNMMTAHNSGGQHHHRASYFDDQESSTTQQPLLSRLPTTPNGEPFPPPEQWSYTMARFQASLIPLSQIEDPPKFFDSLEPDNEEDEGDRGQKSGIDDVDEYGEVPAPPATLPASFILAMNQQANSVNATTRTMAAAVNDSKVPSTLTTMTSNNNGRNSSDLNCIRHIVFAPHAESSRIHHPDQLLKKKKPDNHEVVQTRSETPPPPSPMRRQREPSEALEDVVFYDGDQLHVAQLRTGRAKEVALSDSLLLDGRQSQSSTQQDHHHHPRSISHQWSSRAFKEGRSPASEASCSTTDASEYHQRSASCTSQYSGAVASGMMQQQQKGDEASPQRIRSILSQGTAVSGPGGVEVANGKGGTRHQHLHRPDSLQRSLSAGSGSGGSTEFLFWHRRPSLPKSVMDARSNHALLKRHHHQERHSPILSHTSAHSPQRGATVVRNGGTGSAPDPLSGFPYNNNSQLVPTTTATTAETEAVGGQRRRSRFSNDGGDYTKVRTGSNGGVVRSNSKKTMETARGSTPGPPASPFAFGSDGDPHQRHQGQPQYPLPQHEESERLRKNRIDSGHDAGDATTGALADTNQRVINREPSEILSPSPQQIESPDTVSLSLDGLIDTLTVEKALDYRAESSPAAGAGDNTIPSASPRHGGGGARPRPVSIAVTNGHDFTNVEMDTIQALIAMQQEAGTSSTHHPLQQQPQQAQSPPRQLERSAILPVDFGGFPQLNSSALMTLMDDQWGGPDSKRKERRKKKSSGNSGGAQQHQHHQHRKSKDLTSSMGHTLLSTSEPHRHHHQLYPLDGAEHQRQRLLYTPNSPILSQDSLESAQMQSTSSVGTSVSAATTSNAVAAAAATTGQLFQPNQQQQHVLNYNGSIRQQMLRMNKRHLVTAGGSSASGDKKNGSSISLEDSCQHTKDGDTSLHEHQKHQQQKQRMSFVNSSVSSLDGSVNHNHEYKSLLRDGPQSFDCALGDCVVDRSNGGLATRPLSFSDSPISYRHSFVAPSGTTTTTVTLHQHVQSGRSVKGGEQLERIPSGVVLGGGSGVDSLCPPRSFGQGHNGRFVEETTLPPVRARNPPLGNRIRPTSAPLGSSLSDTVMQTEAAAAIASSASVPKSGSASNVLLPATKAPSSPALKKTHPFLGAMSLTLGMRRQFFAEQKKQRDLEARESAAAVAAVAAQASMAVGSVGSIDFMDGDDDDGGHYPHQKQRHQYSPNSLAGSGATTVGSAEQLEQQTKKRKEKFLEGLKRFLLRPSPNLTSKRASTTISAGTGGDLLLQQEHQLQQQYHHRFKNTATTVTGKGGMTPNAMRGAALSLGGLQSPRRVAANGSFMDDDDDNDDDDEDDGHVGCRECDLEAAADEDVDDDIDVDDSEGYPLHRDDHRFHTIADVYNQHGRRSQDSAPLTSGRDYSLGIQQPQLRQRQRHSLMALMMRSSTVGRSATANGNGSVGDHDLQKRFSSQLLMQDGTLSLSATSNGEGEGYGYMTNDHAHLEEQQRHRHNHHHHHHQNHQLRRLHTRSILLGAAGSNSSSPAALESSSTAMAVATISRRKQRIRSGPHNSIIFAQWRAQAAAAMTAAVVGGDGQHLAADHGVSSHP